MRWRQQLVLGDLVSSTAPAAGTPKKGGTLKVATQAPSAAVNPLTVADSGGLAMLNQTGEFLAFDNNLKLPLQPMLALSWSPNSDGSVWTFKLRPGVTFHNGQAMTADDVVYSSEAVLRPEERVLRAVGDWGGFLAERRAEVDDMTVAFHLEAPNGNFPYLVSSDTYNAIIVPNGTDFTNGRARSSAPARSSSRAIPRTLAPSSSPTRPTGVAAPTWTERTSPSIRVSRRRSSRSRAARSTSSLSSSCRGRRDC